MSDNARVVPVYVKHPGARIDIDFRLVSVDNDTVTTVDPVTISPAGQLLNPDVDINGATAKVWLTDGNDESDYLVTVPINTTVGRKEIGLAIVKVRA